MVSADQHDISLWVIDSADLQNRTGEDEAYMRSFDATVLSQKSSKRE
jgi:hypothetical protein